MSVEQRRQKILDLIDLNGRVDVKTLAITFRVTEDLIRKDLKQLEKLNLVDRVYGGAERKQNKFEASSIRYRRDFEEEAKMIIADLAIKEIIAGETIFLDTSSTSLMLARALSTHQKEITVVTDMLGIMQILSEASHIRLIGIGGDYNHYTGGFVGLSALEQIKAMHFHRAFVSCRSIDPFQGIAMEGFLDIASTKKTIVEQSSKTYLMLIQEKFKPDGVHYFSHLKQMEAIISDEKPEDEILKSFKKAKLKCIYPSSST